MLIKCLCSLFYQAPYLNRVLIIIYERYKNNLRVIHADNSTTRARHCISSYGFDAFYNVPMETKGLGWAICKFAYDSAINNSLRLSNLLICDE